MNQDLCTKSYRLILPAEKVRFCTIIHGVRFERYMNSGSVVELNDFYSIQGG